MISNITQKLIGICVSVIFLVNGCSGTSQQSSTPSANPVVASATSTLSPISTVTATEISPTATIAVTASGIFSAQDTATFVGENVPDNSVFTPGQTFVKTWVIKNMGSLTWTTAYQLVFSASPQGDSLSGPNQINFPQATAPGKTVSLSLPLVAPLSPGAYSVFWTIRNESGETVAVDGGNLWVKIQVCQPNQPCNTPTTGGETTASGVTANLTSFTYDSQTATVDFCMAVSFHQYTLIPAPSLLIDQKPAPFLTGGSDFPSGPGCIEMQYQVSSAEIEQAQQIVLSIDGSLRMTPPPGDPDTACQNARSALRAQYPSLDFQCHFSMGGYYTNLQLPDEMTQEQANALIVDTIEGAIYGPWALTLK
ncbi:MAG: NBR1-Ig-like domain-containing protein [Chloroflexi bacterium]|nr:NBR1-Ig-like domain-containing protein [Chloroflexota bacterium]